MTELTNYQLWQADRFGDIIPEPLVLPSGEVMENGSDEMYRLAQWIDLQAERQLHESE